MSLINKMLQDLESRQGVASGAAQPKPVYQDLRPAVAPGRRSSRTAVWMVLACVAVAGASYSVWDRMRGGAPASTPTRSDVAAAPVRKPIPPFAPTPAPQQIVAQAPAMAAEPVNPPSTAPQPAPIAPAESPSTTSEPPSSAAAVPPAPINAISKTAAPTSKSTKKPAKAKPTATVAKVEQSEAGTVDKRMRPFTAQEKAEGLYRQAATLIDQGRSEDAARELAAAVAADPAHVKARELLVGISLKNGHWREAQQLLEEGIVKSPMYYPFVQLLARVYVERGAEDKALGLLEAAAPRASQDPDYKTLLATLYQRAGRHADAVKAYGQVVEQRPQDARSWLGLAISLEAEKKQDAAAQAYQRARQLGGLSPQLAAYAQQRIQALNK